MHFAGGTVLPLYKPISVRDWMRIPEDQAAVEAVALWSSYLKRYKDYAKDLQSQIGWVLLGRIDILLFSPKVP